MKKLVALLLTVMMTATLSVSAFAETVDKSKDIDVKAEYKDNSTTPDKISVDVSWGAMEFTYTKSGEMKWDDKNHDYTDNTKTEWTENGNTVTVVNHSNVGVTVTFAFVAGEGYDGENGIKGTFSNQTLTLKSAAGVGTDEESLATLTGTTDLTLSGALKSGTVKGTTVGSITVDIKKQS